MSEEVSKIFITKEMISMIETMKILDKLKRERETQIFKVLNEESE